MKIGELLAQFPEKASVLGVIGNIFLLIIKSIIGIITTS